MNHQPTAHQEYICTVESQQEIRYAQDALYILSGKWRMPIIIVLYNGITRYRDLARYIPGITFSMLSRELRFMERNSLITRTEDPDFSKTVAGILANRGAFQQSCNLSLGPTGHVVASSGIQQFH